MRRFAVPLLTMGFAFACDSAPRPAVQSPPAPGEKAEAAPAEPAATPSEKPKPPAAAEVAASAHVGQPAPAFELTDLDGKPHRLADYQGKVVVLEWWNPGCPFVDFAHTSGPLRDMASTQTDRGIVWLAINSGGPGREGHGLETSRTGVEKYAMKHPVLLDETGAVGHLYGAKKTPHMFVIDETGVLRYAGGLDNAPFGKVDGGGEPVNHLAAALADLAAKRDVATPEAPPYGCSVKYSS